MMKKMMTIIALMMAAVHTMAQTTQLLGDNHAMQRIEVKSQYLLLPVQEKEEIANIRVVADNVQQQTLNVRLAVDKVDYYVPLDIKRWGKKTVTLDINFHGDRRTTGAIKEFVCWKEMKQANQFDTANREAFRPAYHHTPAYGWMNDPNGMFYKDGTYHLYYQFNPYGSMWENMTWGHSTSTDLIHWTAQPTAIEPDALGAIFSGSCVVDKNNTAGFGPGAVVAFYTSAGQSQTQSMAVSTDQGTTFKKWADNPILTADIPDFRDPKAFWNPEIQRWNLILAAGQEMRIYSSADLKNWKYESSFGKGLGCHDGVWECPDLMKLQVRGTDRQQWLLICNINRADPSEGRQHSISWATSTGTVSPASTPTRDGWTMARTTMPPSPSTTHPTDDTSPWHGCRTGSMPTRCPPSSSVRPTACRATSHSSNMKGRPIAASHPRRNCSR